MPKPQPASAPGFTAAQLAALSRWIARMDRRTHRRGMSYFRSNRITDFRVEPPAIKATVLGTDSYQTILSWGGDRAGWTDTCTCPVARGCKHAVAVALRTVIERTPVESATAPKKASAAARPQQPTPAPSPLAELRRATSAWHRHRPLQRLLLHCPTDLSAYDERLQEALEENDPDLLCWKLAVAIGKVSGGWCPQPLADFRNRPDLKQRELDHVRSELARELVTWAREKRRPAQRTLRFVLTVDNPERFARFRIEARLTGPRIADEPRRLEQLRLLRSQALNTPGTLAPDTLLLLDTLIDGLERSTGWFSNAIDSVNVDIVRRLLERASGSGHVTWSPDLPPDLVERGGVRAGEPVRLGSELVQLLPSCVVTPHGGRIELHCFFPDGESVHVDRVVHVESHSITSQTSAMVVARGACWIVGERPPDTLLEKFRDAGGVDLEPAQCGPVLGMLATHFDHVRNTLDAHTRFHAVRPLFTLDLRDDDWLQVRLFACTDGEWRPGMPAPPDGIAFEYSPAERWDRYTEADTDTADRGLDRFSDTPALPPVERGESDTPPEIIWTDAPEPKTTQPVLDWLTQTGSEPGLHGRPGGSAPTADDRHIGWWAKASPARMQALGELWDNRPPGVVYLGNDRMRRALSPAHRIFPKVKVKSSGVDFFAVSAEWEAEGMKLTDADVARLRSATTRFVKLPSGWVQRDTVEAYEGVAEVMADLGIEIGGGEQTVSIWQLAHAKQESLDTFERMGADRGALDTLKQLRKRIAAFKGLPSVRLPRGVTAQLRPYQKQGLDFLAHVSSLGLGAVLADDMGLGKTVQALAWLEHLRQGDKKGGPSLVVCPTSVMHNWVREAAQFTPKLRVLLIGRGKERHGLWEHLNDYDLLVTNYALLRRDIERWAAVKLRAAILDEAQNIKNPDADVSRAAIQLHAQHRLALTGTPLENRALDLWSIVQFVNPGYLGNRTHFAARYDRLETPAYVRALLAAKLRPILLRRMKKEVAPELPERIEERRDCELTAGQRKLYLAELQRCRRLVDDLAEQPDGVRRNRIVILAALTRLRQICCHPALAKGQGNLGSGKFEALFELLEPLLAEGHKVLVFSQFVECLNLLRADLQKREIKTHQLTGQTQRREEVVRQFQESPDPSVFLISLKAGGTGLNLTAASYVVVFDPWWNPAVEAQAIDRTHRIGQDRTVIAYRLLALGTIEEKIWELQQKKAALVRDVLGEDGFGRSLTREDLGFLLQEA